MKYVRTVTIGIEEIWLAPNFRLKIALKIIIRNIEINFIQSQEMQKSLI